MAVRELAEDVHCCSPLLGGQLKFNVIGVPGYNYAIEASTDLVNWTPLSTNASPFTFTDQPTAGIHYYRAVWLP